MENAMLLPFFLFVVGLCLSACSCSNGIDEKQYADFLTAARDWQEKTKAYKDAQEWHNTVPESRMQDVVNRGQPDGNVKAAQERIVMLAVCTNSSVQSARTLAEGRQRGLLGLTGSIQRELEDGSICFSLFVAKVDLYSKREFGRIVQDSAREDAERQARKEEENKRFDEEMRILKAR